MWRGADAMEVWAEQWARQGGEGGRRASYSVLHVPLHELTRDWWDAHPGLRTKLKGGPVIDCTHFCFFPFDLEPVWWAVRALATF